MPRDFIGLNAEPFQRLKRAEARRTNRGLRDLRGLQLHGLRVAFLVAEGRMRIHQIAQAFSACVIGKDAVRHIKHALEFGELARQIAQHADILRSLTGKNHAKLAGHRAAAVKNAIRRVPGGFALIFFEHDAGVFQEFRQRVLRFFQHDNQAMRLFRVECAARFGGSAAQRFPRHIRGNLVECGLNVRNCRGGKGKHLRFARPVNLRFARRVFFQHAVEVRTAEPERA